MCMRGRNFSPRVVFASAVNAAMWSQRVVGLQGSGSLRHGVRRLSEVCLFLPEFPLNVTGWLIIEHGRTVRFVDGPFGTVGMCVAGGVDANVFTCFSVGGTGLNGVTVRLFFTAGGIGDPRVVLIFHFSPGGSGWSFCPAALSLLRGFGAAWSSVLEARPCGGC